MLTTILAAIEAALAVANDLPQAQAALSDIFSLGKGGADPTQAEVDAAIAASKDRLAQAEADAAGLPTVAQQI